MYVSAAVLSSGCVSVPGVLTLLVAKARRTVFTKKMPLELPMNWLSFGETVVKEPTSIGGTDDPILLDGYSGGEMGLRGEMIERMMILF